MDPIYQAIEFAVQVNGARAVADFDADVAKLKADLNLLQAQLQATGATTQLTQEMAKLVEQLRDAEQAAAAAHRVLGGMPAQMRSAESSSRGASMAILELSRAFEDFNTGGFIGVINNVPGVVRGVGMACGVAAPELAILEGAISAAATTGYALYKNWDTLMNALGTGRIRTEAEEMEELHKATKRTADQEERYQELKERAEHVKNQGKDTDETATFEKDVDKAVSEAGVDQVNKGIDKHFGNRIRAQAEVDSGQDLEAMRKAVADAFGPTNVLKARQALQEAEGKVDAAYGHARENFLADLTGKPDTARAVATAAAAHPGDFGPRGADFARDLREADPRTKKNKEVDEAVELAGSIGRDAERDNLAARAKKQGEVDEAVETAWEISQKIDHDREKAKAKKDEEARESVEQAEAIARDAGADNAKAEAKEKKQTETAKEKAIREQATRVAPGFKDDLKQTLLGRVGNGEEIGAVAADLGRQLKGKLGARDVQLPLQADVAKQIVEKVREEVANLLQGSSNPKATARAAALGDKPVLKMQEAQAQAPALAAEFQRRTGATDQEATMAGNLAAGLVGQGANVEQALNGAYADMTGNLQGVSQSMRRMLANSEQMIGLFGNASQWLAQINSTVDQQTAKINALSGNLGRGAVGKRSTLQYGMQAMLAASLVGLGVGNADAAAIHEAVAAVPVMAKRLEMQDAKINDLANWISTNFGRLAMGRSNGTPGR